MKVLQKMHENWSFNEVEFYANISENSVNFANIMEDLKLKEILDNQQNIASVNFYELLNTTYKQIDAKYKSLSRILKLSIIEKIIAYYIKQNTYNNIEQNCAMQKQVISLNNNLIKQFIAIKRFELPVKFL